MRRMPHGKQRRDGDESGDGVWPNPSHPRVKFESGAVLWPPQVASTNLRGSAVVIRSISTPSPQAGFWLSASSPICLLRARSQGQITRRFNPAGQYFRLQASGKPSTSADRGRPRVESTNRVSIWQQSVVS
jgi:hypothetical protein